MPLYAAGVALRWAAVRPARLRWPVVSVGNLSAGGTGKTPFTIALAGLLTREGFAVDVLSRGYGRASQEVERVDPLGNADRFGDEPLLIACEAGVPVFVGARRVDAGRLAEASLKNGVHSPVHLLDDGFQHRRLYRDVDVVLVNAEDLSDFRLPAGNLREGLGALRRAGVLAVPSEDDAAVSRLRGLGMEQLIWRFRREMVVPVVAGPVVAFCGIARPGQFLKGLAGNGMMVAASRVFRDHHRFSERDVDGLIELARKSSATVLVTTEKDRVRLGGLALKLEGALPLVAAGLRIELEDEAGVAAWLNARLASG